MRLRISHETTYRYERPLARAQQILRLTPQHHQGQFVSDWRLEVSTDGRLTPIDDPFGNVTHAFSVDGPIDLLSVAAAGEISTDDTAGIVRGAVERLPTAVYLRQTPLTEPDEAIRTLAAELGTGAVDALDILHRLNAALHERIRLEPATHVPVRHAAETVAKSEGTPQDVAHVFVGAARHLGIPTRYVSGYLHRDAASREADAGHAWAEAFVDGIGWIGFDPSLGLCPTDAHVRVAVALDWLGAAPLRGARTGGDGEVIAVRVVVDAASGA
jgi:transglutaminase-like putative cysteine protease